MKSHLLTKRRVSAEVPTATNDRELNLKSSGNTFKPHRFWYSSATEKSALLAFVQLHYRHIPIHSNQTHLLLPENHELHIISTPMPQTFTLISFLVEYHLLERLGPVTNNKTEIEIRFVFLENWTTSRGGGVDVKWTLDSSSHGKEREVWCLFLVNYVQYRP